MGTIYIAMGVYVLFAVLLIVQLLMISGWALVLGAFLGLWVALPLIAYIYGKSE